ncbi:hypothetical protein DL96DRAFT_1557535 [Flagelloscypha sp. PMI_526]|nr:hypothetical protein DL96DRAFT_1557535 [Flagelloscypha sp. PMI_526]
MTGVWPASGGSRTFEKNRCVSTVELRMTTPKAWPSSYLGHSEALETVFKLGARERRRVDREARKIGWMKRFRKIYKLRRANRGASRWFFEDCESKQQETINMVDQMKNEEQPEEQPNGDEHDIIFNRDKPSAETTFFTADRDEVAQEATRNPHFKPLLQLYHKIV